MGETGATGSETEALGNEVGAFAGEVVGDLTGDVELASFGEACFCILV